ncbi:MAG: hypothetical protein IPF55_18340 [Rhodoferax sp.]|nr:hypothetical protein [Rhodoferax sp.]
MSGAIAWGDALLRGMTLDEIAEVMGLSVPTLKRDWRRARAFLFDYLSA